MSFRKNILALTVSLALPLVATANEGYIEQSGSNQLATITQTAGVGAGASIIQTGSTDNTASIEQTAGFVATIYQTGGYDNEAAVRQLGTPSSASTASLVVRQTGQLEKTYITDSSDGSNTYDTSQSGVENYLNITTMAGVNSATYVNQLGTGGVATINFEGSTHTVNLTQDGGGAITTVDADGNNNIITINQNGAKVAEDINGDYNTTNVNASSINGYVQLDIIGDGNEVGVSQSINDSGEGSLIVAIVDGSNNNGVQVYQESYANTANVSIISSDENDITVRQDGDQNDAAVSISGTGSNLVNIDQRGCSSCEASYTSN